MPNPTFVPQYPACNHIQRDNTNITISEDVLKAITEEAEVFPLFEEKKLNYKIMKGSSMQRNELLKCRWTEYLKKIQGRVKVPFKFPSVFDVHYCHHLVRYDPKQSISNKETNRFHLKPGPGVDKFGQMPIPDDMHLRKTEVDKIIKAVKKEN